MLTLDFHKLNGFSQILILLLEQSSVRNLNGLVNIAKIVFTD